MVPSPPNTTTTLARDTRSASATPPVPARFELRLHERDHGASWGQDLRDRTPDEPEADECEVGGHQIARAADLVAREIARVDPLEADDPGVGPEAPGQLSASDIHRVYARGARAKQPVGEPAGARSQVHRDQSVDIDPERRPPVGEFDASPADVRPVSRADPPRHPGRHPP